MLRPTAAWIVRCITAVMLVLAVPAVVFAHDRLKSSVPAADATLTAVPHELRLNFSEVPDLKFSSIRLVDSAGRPVALSAVTYAADSKRAIIAAVLGPMIAGRYTIQWQVVGDDGHPTRDEIHFVIGAGATGIGAIPAGAAGNVTALSPASSGQSAGAAASAGGNEFGVESVAYVVIRWVTFITLLLAIGAAAFRQGVLRSLTRAGAPDDLVFDAARRAARMGYRASLLFLITLVARLLAQSLAMNSQPTMFDVDLIGGILRHTVWGVGWHLQLLGVLIAGFGFDRAARGVPARPATVAWLAASLGVALLAFSSGLAGHAAAAPRLGALVLIADGLHIVGGGGWLGSLTVMLLAGIPSVLALPEERRGKMMAALLNAFSPTALIFAGLVATTGVFAAWIHVGSIPALWQTPYGRMLFRKLVVLSAAVAIGAYNWLRLKPAASRGDNIAGSLRVSGTLEVVVGLVVLLLTAILVAMPTAMDMKM